MKKKANIYDSDDAQRSKRLSFTPEERAAYAQQKAEVLGQKLEQAEKKIPKKKKVRLQKEFDPQKSRMKHPATHALWKRQSWMVRLQS